MLLLQACDTPCDSVIEKVVAELASVAWWAPAGCEYRPDAGSIFSDCRCFFRQAYALPVPPTQPEVSVYWRDIDAISLTRATIVGSQDVSSNHDLVRSLPNCHYPTLIHGQ
jgi:hypothetical protein